MRTFKHLLRIILAVLLTAYLLLLVAFNFGPAQRAVTRTVADVVTAIAESVGVPGASALPEILERFDPRALPREPYVWR